MMRTEGKQTIAIVGGGFGGVRAALDLNALLERDAMLAKQYRVVVIDASKKHLFVPALYDIVAAPSDPTMVSDIEAAITIPYTTLFKNTPHVHFIQDSVTAVDPTTQQIHCTDSEPLFFSRCILAVGSRPAFYDIDGLKKHAHILRDLASATRLRSAIRAEQEQGPVRIVVGGGGVSGVETAGELAGYLQDTSPQKEHSSHVSIVHADNRILPHFTGSMSAIAQRRLRALGVSVHTNERITAVSDTVAKTQSDTHPFDVLVWAGGIRPAALVDSLPFKKDARGRVCVDQHFSPYTPDGKSIHRNIFVIGDSCCFKLDGEPLPATAWSAINQGEYIARALYTQLTGGALQPYKPLSQRYIVHIKGRYALAHIGPFVIAGWHVWLLKQLVYLRYLMGTLPSWRAVPKWVHAFWLSFWTN